MKSQLNDVENRFLRKCDNFLFEWIIMLVTCEQEIWEGMCNYINSILNFKGKKKLGRNCGINLSLLSVLQYLRQLVRKYMSLLLIGCRICYKWEKNTQCSITSPLWIFQSVSFILAWIWTATYVVWNARKTISWQLIKGPIIYNSQWWQVSWLLVCLFLSSLTCE